MLLEGPKETVNQTKKEVVIMKQERKKGIGKLRKKGGFTLAELLIVVAIIAVLAAIAIPIFNSNLTKAKKATSIANIRTAYAQASAAYLTKSTEDVVSIDGDVVTVNVDISTAVANSDLETDIKKTWKIWTTSGAEAEEIPANTTSLVFDFGTNGSNKPVHVAVGP